MARTVARVVEVDVPLTGLPAELHGFTIAQISDIHWIRELRRLGARVLMNEHVVLDHDGAALAVAGVTDYSAHHFDPSHRSDAPAAMAGVPHGAVKLLLAHQPRSAAGASAAGFDLQRFGIPSEITRIRLVSQN